MASVADDVEGCDVNDGFEDVWRAEVPHVLAALTRRHGQFEECEDAVQQALEAALEQWPREGPPEDPTAWLFRVASRRLIEQFRRDSSRRRREEAVARLDPEIPPESDFAREPDADADLLQLMVLCCHPALSRNSQVALMLRAVAGLTTRQIAAGFMVPEATMGQRISRAKATLTKAGARFDPPAQSELPERILSIRHAVSLLYTQGHMQSDGAQVADGTLRGSAISLARRLQHAVPRDPENAGLLALLLLSEARMPARIDTSGDFIPLEDQDRTLWDRALIHEGIRLLEAALPHGYVGTFQLQAAIAAVHAEAVDHGETDWGQILALYEMLEHVAPSTATRIGWATALAEVRGPRAGLEALDSLSDTDHHRFHAVRGHLLARLGETEAARQSLSRAARLTRSIPEQRYLNRVIDNLG